jgi:hypothetical protein
MLPSLSDEPEALTSQIMLAQVAVKLATGGSLIVSIIIIWANVSVAPSSSVMVRVTV